MVGDSNGETNFPHMLLIANTQVSKCRKAIPNRSSGNIKVSKTQLPKMIQLRGLLFLIPGGTYVANPENLILRV